MIELDFIEPLELFQSIAHLPDFTFLYSSRPLEYSGKRSFLALYPDQELIADNADNFAKLLSDNKDQFDNAWFGYLSYELGADIEKLPVGQKYQYDMPLLHMMRYNLVLIWNHEDKTLYAYTLNETYLKRFKKDQIESNNSDYKFNLQGSNMSKSEYFDNVDYIKEQIKAGTLYQANLTRKFYGKLKYKTHLASLFTKLCQVSSAPYSAYIRHLDSHIISSSPEQFLEINSSGMITTHPIKGTGGKGQAAKLLESAKDRAENLMIVDLMRHDLSRSCVIGSVNVPKLFEIIEHPTLTHMSSTVIGQKRDDCSSIDAVLNAFPPGSMTGTPKLKAIELCQKLEQYQRGIYSGAIGWFGGDGSVDLSVVIRTLVVQGDYAEFQVGGAIIHDSDADNEWQETMIKAKGLAKALNISINDLEQL